MDTLLADLKYSLRLLRKSPAFTAVAVATLALGIGANTAIFSAVDAVLIRPLPYTDPDRVVLVWEENSAAGFPRNTPAPGNFTDWTRMQRSFSGMAATRGGSASVTSDGPPEQILGRRVSQNFFEVLGVRPAIGRTFTKEEDRTSAAVVVISDGLWKRRYGGDRGILGRTILMSDNRYEVIGVMPPGFVFRDREIDYWAPIDLTPAVLADHNSHFLNVVARLAPGVSPAAANDDMGRVAKELARQFPNSNTNIGAVVVPVKDDALGNTRVELLVLMGAAAAVLLIACANLASLLLSRAVGRRGELAVRAALGASRGRLVRQLVIEASMVALAGGGIGLMLAPAATAVMAQLTPRGFPALPSSVLDLRLLGFTLSLSLATAVVFSIVPALQASRVSLQDALQQGARSAVGGRGRLTRDALVVLQVAAALVLLVGAGLMLRTLANLRAIDVGFRADRLMTLRTTLPSIRYRDFQKRLAFYERVTADARRLPGVEQAAYISNLPFTAQGNSTYFEIEGGVPPKPGEPTDALYRVGTADYLSTIGARVIEGRLIDDRDVAGAPPAVVINETMRRRYWPDASPLGHRLRFGVPNSPLFTIVGVVKDLRERGYELAMKPAVYMSFAQTPTTWALPEFLAVRVRGNPLDIVDALRRSVAAADPDQPIAAVRTMDEILDLDVADRHQQMVLLGSFAALALLLASIGLYGVLSYVVAQRSRELGLRMALGATGGAVMRMVVARGLTLTVTGLMIGLALAFALTRTLQNLLYGVAASDPVTFAAVAGLLGVIALAACYLPARRAARLDPIVVLRAE
jgi:putative ABC transport system permease protein